MDDAMEEKGTAEDVKTKPKGKGKAAPKEVVESMAETSGETMARPIEDTLETPAVGMEDEPVTLREVIQAVYFLGFKLLDSAEFGEFCQRYPFLRK